MAPDDDKAANGEAGATGESRLVRLAHRPFHPFLVALIPLLGLFAANAHELPLDATLVPAAISLAAAAAIFAAARLLTANARKAGVLASLAVVFVAYYGLVFNVASFAVRGRLDNEVFVPVWLVAFGAAIWRIARSRRDFAVTTFVLNTVAVCAVAVAAVDIAAYQLTTAVKRPAEPAWRTPGLPEAPAVGGGTAPDIYFLVFDRYAAADVLAEVYGFDNGAFLAALEARGFYVARDSAANYPRTSHSLAATLNFDYLDHLSARFGASDDVVPLNRMVEDYKAWRFLERRGYRFIHLGSWWDATMRNRFADENHNWRAVPELERVLLRTTLIDRVGSLLGLYPFDTLRHQCERVRFKFERLRELAARPERKYVFAHFLTPHPPFVLDRDGRCMGIDEATSRSRTRNYTGQIEAVNAMILDLVDDLLARAERPPVIIVQSDEGPWPARYAGNEFGAGPDNIFTDWTKASTAEMREKIRILNAMYLPGGEPAPLHPGITPVNTFRVVFNRYFGTDLPLLPDKSYFFEDPDHVYSFFEVTERVR